MSPPQTGFLSLFEDPPENPLREGGNWYPPFLGDHNFGSNVNYLDMRKEGGDATDQPHGTQLNGIIAYSYWTREQFAGDQVEVWGLPSGGQLGAALESWRLFMWSGLNNPTGYLVYIGGGLSKDTVIRKYGGGSFEDIAGTGGGYSSALMLRINGNDIEAWAVPYPQDWEDPDNWVLRTSIPDITYRGPFYIGMGIEDPTNGGLSWLAFGGGKPHRTQIYRILKALK